MILFLLVFLSVYGGMQFVIFWKVHRAFPGLKWWLVAPGAFLLLMLFAPMLVRIADRADWVWPTKIVALVGFTWMAVSLWFLFAAVGTELWNAGARAVALSRGTEPRLMVSARGLLVGVGVWTVLAITWGLVEASCVRLERITVRSAKLPAGSRAITVAQISDLHLGPLFAGHRLQNALRLVKRANPDVVVSTGDLVDTTGTEARRLIAPLKAVDPPLGKFAVLGNHETYSGLERSLKFHRAAGFRVLREERQLLDGRLWVAGVDDPAGRRGGGEVKLDEDVALPPEGAKEFVLLLKHRPAVLSNSLRRFDLQLSGHTHRGQIFPFVIVVAALTEHLAGLYELEGGARLYVSRGAGCWGPPLRLFSPPEVALITIEPQAVR